ncbi:MAG: hypothetical protein M1831_003996 [Alyxoria varia]|nr:MAG: hypothetical protein M1831_003996 [Alyxoria varia]
MASTDSDATSEVTIKFSHGGKQHSYTFGSNAVLSDLSDRIASELSVPPASQKFLIAPKTGMLKGPFHGQEKGIIPLQSIASKKITLIGSTQAEISSLNASIAAASMQPGSSPVSAAKPSRTRDWKTLHDATTYTFLQIRPLPNLPSPERSTRFLERLRDDPGIKSTMAKHQWSVPLLTEMNPADHTTHDGRTLGLNRNGGEVIELRLRTDAYDGYRDYKTIRKTLCHELTHNVHGEHDRKFWDLCRQVEREVESGDWKSGGRALTNEVFHEPEESEMVADHGGWTGGEFVLGGGSGGGRSSGAGSQGAAALSRREILAKAAEERMKKSREASSSDQEQR